MSGESLRRLLAVLVLLALVLLLALAARHGWRARARRGADIPAPAPVPDGPGEPVLEVDGTYVTTTRAGDPLDRVTAHGLGPRAAATLSASPAGVVFERDGSPPFLVPSGDVVGVGTSAGMVGKAPGRQELLLLRWRAGAVELDTGFRPGRRADRAEITALADRLQSLLDPASAGPGQLEAEEVG